jgi:hypothetical protein
MLNGANVGPISQIRAASMLELLEARLKNTGSNAFH